MSRPFDHNAFLSLLGFGGRARTPENAVNNGAPPQRGNGLARPQNNFNGGRAPPRGNVNSVNGGRFPPRGNFGDNAPRGSGNAGFNNARFRNGFTNGANAGVSNGVRNSESSVIGVANPGSDNSNPGAPQERKVRRFISVHVAPDEPARNPKPRFVQPQQPPELQYNILFIRAPSVTSDQPTEIVMPSAPEQKTIVYVLMKRPGEEMDNIKIRPATPTQPPKPEVFFLQYRGGDGQVSGNTGLPIAGGNGVENQFGAGNTFSGFDGSNNGISGSLPTALTAPGVTPNVRSALASLVSGVGPNRVII